MQQKPYIPHRLEYLLCGPWEKSLPNPPVDHNNKLLHLNPSSLYIHKPGDSDLACLEPWQMYFKE